MHNVDEAFNKSNSFSEFSLRYFNYISEIQNKMDLNELGLVIKKFIPEDWKVNKEMLKLVQNNISTLNRAQEYLSYFFIHNLDTQSESYKAISEKSFINYLKLLQKDLRKISSLNSEIFKQIVNNNKQICDMNIANVWKPLRYVLTGTEDGPEIGQIAHILGSDECCRRLNSVIENN